ncbi:glycoside hydrolase [Paenibacillus sp. LMG 31458]|uniref:beta-fructofuranosidase n=1 Tax=Paenibacillus phytorum TaxID=2654977 RepID=A0ABX1Y702_9BACL|nr:GH32 C-terminal domain-containing protein [Paenibacillus phytorum]NOU76708.1 glycoside hydrolase [Paenibacillus phytorum]
MLQNEKDTSLLAHWSFDEVLGKTAQDSISKMNDSIDYVFNHARFKASSDPQRRKGIRGNALLFDGYSTWIKRSADQISKPSDALTLEAWVAPRSYEFGDEHRLSAIINQHDREKKEGFILGMYRHGTWSMQLGLDNEWGEVWSEEHPLSTNEWSYVAATYDKEACEMKLYLNGIEVASKQTPAPALITPSSQDLLIGKNNQAAVLADDFSLHMFNGLIDEVKIYNRALSSEEISSSFDRYLAPYGGEIPSIPYDDLKLDRSLLASDRHRPQFHVSPPAHWMNEPHAPIYFNGQYHLFYQHNPQGPYWHQIHWGHWVSDDMVHWRDLPVALSPEKNAVDPDGDWSGSAAYDENGLPVLFFTAGDDSAEPNQRVGLARSTFAQDGDNDLVHWVKHPTPVVIQQKGIGKFGDFRDPFVWKDGDTWYMLVGSGTVADGGTAFAYTSKNLTDWEYKGPFYISNHEKYPYLGPVWELPVLLPLGKDKHGHDKHVFLISPVGADADVEVYYWIGTFDKEHFRFIPDQDEPQLIDVGDFHFTGPSGMVDPKTDRNILFTIAQGQRTPALDYSSGWAHNGGLPVSLFLRDDGRLGVEPIEELQSLRGKKLASFTNKSLKEANSLIHEVKGDMLDIILELEPETAKQFGLKVRRSPEGEEETLLYYDAEASTLNVNRMKTTLDKFERSKGNQGGSLELGEENLKLHIYLDRSMIEAYANGIKSLTTRAYPSRSDSLGLQIWGDGSVKVRSMEVWEMNSAFGSTVPAYVPEQFADGGLSK